MLFKNREDAGKKLGEALQAYAGRDHVVVVGLPRGGVAVAAEVAASLRAPLDIVLVRKVGVPGREELAAGAIAEGGVHIWNEDLIATLQLTASELEPAMQREEQVLAERTHRYRDGREPPSLTAKIVILVDDGLATGATMRAAVQALRTHDPARIVVAVPIAHAEAVGALERTADKVVCLESPPDFDGVGKWYEEFSQLGDDVVVDLLGRRDPIGSGEPC